MEVRSSATRHSDSPGKKVVVVAAGFYFASLAKSKQSDGWQAGEHYNNGASPQGESEDVDFK
jgi:hypothetical protein